MTEQQLATLKQLGDLGCYASMDTRLCKVAADEIESLRQQVTLLRDATKKALNGILFHHDPEQVRVGIDAANEALAATEPKP